jgi:mannosidase alpha-like ER degradation enhancer 2
MLNRRGLLMEQSLNEHYTHQLFDFLPQLKGYTLMADEDKLTLEDKEPPEKKQNLVSPTKLGILRWRQLDNITGETTCFFFSESLDSHWSFQWCPNKNTIYQGRRESNGLFQPIYNLGTGRSLPNVDKAEDKETMSEITSIVQHLVTTAKAKYPSAEAIHPYVDGDTCVEGGSQRRTSVIVVHESTSARCSKREGREMIIESVVEVRVCQYMLHVCMDRSNERLLAKNKIDSSENDNDDEASSSFPKRGTDHITKSNAEEINQTLHYIKNQITESFVRKSRADAQGKSRENVLTTLHSALPPLPQTRIKANLKLVKDMFIHAYDSYMYHGFPASEVKPISCAPASFNLVKIPGLTLIDSLDTLVIFGNYTEFARAVERLRFLNDNVYEETGIYSPEGGLFNVNQNVSVFETNIRVLGGLLSAHQLATAFLEDKVLEKDVWAEDKSVLIGVNNNPGKDDCNEGEIVFGLSNDCDTTSTILQCNQESSPKMVCHNQTYRHWEYDGFLLELARDIGDRLLPAFNTETGIPYGTVNLLSGIPKGETPIASLAGGGTLSLEMELLSRLTGNNEYGRAAKLATRALWMRRSHLGVLGKHICTQKGQWTETLSGIGSNSDSFYEYLIKHHILFPEDSDFWLQLVAAYGGVHNETRVGEWYGDVDMYRGRSQNGAPRRVLEALMAFYPGMQVLLGEVTPAARTLNSFFLVREYLGFLPERFQFESWKVDYGGGSHLLRPELLESAYFLHRSSKGFQNQFRARLNNYTTSDSSGWVWSGDFALHTIEKLTRTECGYGSIRDVSPETSGKLKAERSEIRLLDEMPSYFLSETLKYLYLLFDDNNILHTDEEHDWVFTTEAHPIHYEQKETSVDTKLIEQTEELKLRIQRRLDKRKKSTNDIRKGLIKEKWTEASNMEEFVHQLEPLMKNDNKIYEDRRLIDSYVSQDANSFSTAIERLFPKDNSWSPFDVFNERLQMLNPTFLSFRKLGNELDLTNSCPNLYASNFLWIRALNGGIADYSDSYKSRTSDDFMVSERDIIQLGSVDALALHGTGVHIQSLYDAFYQSSIRDKIKSKDKKTSNALKNGEMQEESSNGPTRFEMGDDMGSFDIYAFPGGSGFFVRHVESGETVVTTLIEEDSSIDSQGPLVFVYSKSNEGSNDVDISQDHSQDNIVANRNPRAAVLADLRGNSYSCEVQIIESKIRLEEDSSCNIDTSQGSGTRIEDKIMHRFPCSPALFGPTHISHLEKVGSIEVEAKIQQSGVNDEYGCGRFSMNSIPKGSDREPELSDSASSHSDKVVDDEKVSEFNKPSDKVISIVQRGECTFQEKSLNKKLTERAEGVIVINNNKGDDLFVMSGGGSEELANLDLKGYPVTVLVTLVDGRHVMEMMNANDNNNNGDTQINARISLVQEQFSVDTELTVPTKNSESQFWPQVKASSDALRIYSHSGWGIHAVQMPVDDKNSDVKQTDLQWQLYLSRLDMDEESVPDDETVPDEETVP